MLFFLVFVYAISSAVRLHQHNYILTSSDHNVDGHVILSGSDGYRWLRYADEMRRGVYFQGAPDALSGSPVHASSPPVFPLISRMINVVSDMTGKSSEVSAGLMTVFLSGLFIFPLGLFLWFAGFPAAAAGGAVTGSLCFAYLGRTAGFQPDTDMLNLFFPFTIILFISLARRRPYLFSALAGFFCFLHYQWYFHSGFSLVWLALLAAYLLIGGISFKTAAVSAAIFTVFSGAVQVFHGLTGLAEFSGGSAPLVSARVAELVVPGFVEGLRFLTADGWTALFGIVVCLFRFRRLWLLSPVFLLGVLMFFRGERYGMYLGVFPGIGVGCALGFLLSHMRFGRELSAALTVFLCLLLVRPFLSFIPAPFVQKGFFDTIYRMNLPDNALVMSRWDYGFLIEYLKKVQCASDGATQTKPGRVLTDRLMAASSGETGIMRLAAGCRPVVAVVTPGDGYDLGRGFVYGGSSDASVKKISDGRMPPRIIRVRSENGRNDDIWLKYGGSGAKIALFNNKTRNSFFGKTWIIESVNVDCIQSVVRNNPLVSVYKADAACVCAKDGSRRSAFFK